MKLLDTNLLLYAVNQDFPQHPQARAWLEKTLSDEQIVGLPWVVVLAFLRVTTRPQIFSRPLTVEKAVAYIDEWITLPIVTIVSPGQNHWPILYNLLTASGTGGNLTTDAHIAALAIEHGYTVYSTDYDFKRFSGIRHVNPLGP